jgi:hypothetical protein
MLHLLPLHEAETKCSIAIVLIFPPTRRFVVRTIFQTNWLRPDDVVPCANTSASLTLLLLLRIVAHAAVESFPVALCRLADEAD